MGYKRVSLALTMQVLYDLGVVSTKEPFQKLVSQGMILGDWEYTALQVPDGSFAEDDSKQGTAVKSVQQPLAHTCASQFSVQQSPCMKQQNIAALTIAQHSTCKDRQPIRQHCLTKVLEPCCSNSSDQICVKPVQLYRTCCCHDCASIPAGPEQAPSIRCIHQLLCSCLQA